MTWNPDEFFRSAVTVFDEVKHKEMIHARLPNEGESVEEICKNGMEQFTKDGPSLIKELIKDSG